MYGQEVKQGKSNELTAKIDEQKKKVEELRLKAKEAALEILKMFKAGSISEQQKTDAIQTVRNVNAEKTYSDRLLTGIKKDHDADAQWKEKAREFKEKLNKAIQTYSSATQEAKNKANALLEQLRRPTFGEYDGIIFAHIDQSNVQNVIKKIENDTNAIITALQKQHEKVGRETAYSGKTKEYEQLLNESLANTTFEDATFKNAKVDSSGKTVLTFLEVFGDKVRETKVYIDDANEALDRLTSNSGKDFDIYSYKSKSNYRNARMSDFYSFDEEDRIQAIIGSYKELSRTEKQYQTLRASVDNGAATDQQKADYEILCALRERYNNIIAEGIGLLSEEEKLYYDNIGKSKIEEEQRKYNARKEIESGRYDVLANMYHVDDIDEAYEEATRINNALNNTSQLMDRISKKNLAGFDVVFDSAQKEVEELNSDLKSGVIDVDTYLKKMQNIAGELNSVVAVIDLQTPQQVENAMKKFAKSLPKAEFGKFDELNNTLTVKYQKQKGVVSELTLEYDKMSKTIRKVKEVSSQSEGSLSSFLSGLKKRAQSLVQYLLTFASFYRIWGWIRQGVTVIRELDTALTEMRKVSDETVSSLKNFQQVSFDIAESVGATASQIQNSAADFMRLGYSLQEASDLAKDANIYANVGDMEIDEATEHMISSIKAWSSEFNSEVEASSAIIDRYNEIGNNFAISSADIGSAMERSASALKAGGNTLNESLGLIVSGNIIQQDAETTAAALKVLSLRIRGSKTDLEEMGEETDGLASSTSKLREEIKALTGVDIMLDENTYKSTAQIIQEIGKEWDKLTDVSQAALLEKLAGKNRASTVAGLLENYEIIEEVIKKAEGAEGSALEENERYLESIQGRIDLFTNELQEFWYNLLDSDMVKEVVDAGTKLIQILDNVTSAISDTDLVNVVVKPLSWIIDLIEKLTSVLGVANFPLAIAGISKLVQLVKGKNGGGRAKIIKMSNYLYQMI